MGSGIFFPLGAIPFSILIIVLFYVKGHVKNRETKIYEVLIISNLVGLLIELACTWASKIYNVYPLISNVIYKSYLLYIIVWISTFAYYIYCISRENKSEVRKERYAPIVVYFFIMTLIIMLLPIKVVIANDFKIRYTSGAAVDFSYIVSGIALTVIIISMLSNIKALKNKKYVPVFIFLALGGIAICIQTVHPEILIMTYVETLISVIMFFTMENPDLKMIAALEIARDHAEKANRAKSDFLSSMSHEIRTPLNAIVGLSEDIATYKDQVPKEVVEDTEDIRNASQTLLEIVGNILDINKIEADKMEIVCNPYNFKEEITNMCKVTATRIGEKDIQFNLCIADDIPYELIGDKGKVKEIVNNLLSNSIKYTEQGQINLTVKCVNDMSKNVSVLYISCQDTGRGIKAEDIEKLFTKFERLDIEKNSTTEGTGLGLAITKTLVEMMGGKINVKSQFGQGSIFMVQLPQQISKFSRPMTEEELSDTAKRLYINKTENKEKNYANKRILIVDDNKLNIKVANRALKDFNFIIDECYDGLECLEKIRQGNTYDLILMDIMMPNMSGRTALEKLKENKDFTTPVIALTADAVAGSREKYIGEGFTDYIAKPFSKEQIAEKLDVIFAGGEEMKVYDPHKWDGVTPYVIVGNADDGDVL